MSIADLQDLIEAKRNSLKTDRLDMSFGEIVSMYTRDEIIIDPEYQRLFRWSLEQQTRFIESILLGIPIPPIFVAENKDGKWEVVDGLQRISTILSFFGVLKTMPEKNNWVLQEGDLIKDLNNFKYDQLSTKLQLNIKRYVCRIEVLNWNSEIDVRYELFNRLNTGGTQLSDQEIRNCIFRGTDSSVNKFLEDMSDRDDFIGLVAISDTQIEQLYLEELVLRFACLYDSWESVQTNINNYMTEYMRKAVENKNINIPQLSDLFIRTINVLLPLGSEIFRYSRAGFSTSLFDAIFIGISKNIVKYEHDPGLAKTKIDELKASTDFRKNTGSAASGQYRVIKRIKIAIDIFK